MSTRYVKDKRPTISPNFNFLGQLIEYEKLLRQEAVEEERRRHKVRFIASPASSSVEERDSSSPAFMDLHSTAKSSPSSPKAKTVAHQAVPSTQDNSASSFTLSQLAPTTCSPSGNLETAISEPLTPAFLSPFLISGANFQTEDPATQECPFPGPDSLDFQTLTPTESTIFRRLPGTEIGEGEQLLLRHKRTGPSRLGLRPTSAPTPYTGCLDPQNLPGPLLQHRQLFEAALRQESGHSKNNHSIAGEQNYVQPNHTLAQSPVCPVTGFPSPGMTHEDSPQSTCPVITGFPGPHSVGYHTNNSGNSENLPVSLTDTPNMFTIPGSVATDLTTYQDNQSSNSPFLDSQNISQDCVSSGSTSDASGDSPGGSGKNVLKGSQQQPNKRFSFSSMFSGFRWRSRPPTLPLSSPVGSMKKHGGESGMVDSRNQLTPVSEAIENSDLNPPDSITSTAGATNILVSSHSSSSDPIILAELAKEGVEETNFIGSNNNHFNASSQTSGYSSVSLSFSAPSLSTSSSGEMSSSNDNIISKPGSLRLRAKGFTLSLSSPTSNFPVKFSPSSMPSPSDSTNKRKSFLPSSSNSPDKLAKTDSPIPQPQSQFGVSAIVPPKTLNLAQSTMGKLKQRLSGKKSMALPISSPTAAMAKLNFASPSAELPSSSLLCQNHEEIGESSSKSGHHVSMADDVAKISMDLVPEDHRTYRKGKEHNKREGSKSLFLRKSKWSEERSSLKLEATATQKCSDTPLTSSLVGSLSSGSSMSSSSISSRMSLSFSSSTMSSSTYSDMSSSSNMSSSPPLFPTHASSKSCPHPSPLAAAAATTSFHLQGLSEFPTTSLDKLSFTPCYTKDIVQELKQQESARKTATSGPIPTGDRSSGPSALDSPMSISSGSSAPSVASSTLSPVESNLANPFSDGPSHYDVMETLAAYPLPQSPQPIETPLDQEEDYDDSSALPSFVGSPSEEASISADLSLRSPSDFDPLSPSSLPQATMAPTLPTTPSSFYYSSSSIEPLSPMSLSDNSSSNSPMRSPTRHLQQQHLPQHHQHPRQQTLWGQDASVAASFSPCISSVASSLSMPMLSASSGGCGASSSMSSSITSPLSSLSQLSSASSIASTSKVVLRKHRPKGADGQLGTCNAGSNTSKHVILDRPNSIAFSHYPTCDLVAPSPPSAGTGASVDAAVPSPASLDDASEAYMSSARRSFRNKHRHQQTTGPELYARQGRTSWGAYSEREVYRQITAAMETAMLRTHAYGRRLGQGSGRHISKGHSRKARSLDDILDSSVRDVEFLPCRRVGVGARSFTNNSRYTGQKEQYPCGMRSGSEPYHSNSSLSSNGSHGSSLEIIQVS